MSPLRSRSQANLEALRDRLTALEGSLPRMAKSACARREKLAAGVKENLGFFVVRLTSKELVALEKAVDELEALAEAFGGLDASLAELRREFGQLRGRALAQGDDVRDWIEERCQQWGEEISSLGSTAVTPQDVAVEEVRAESIRGELRQHFLALFRLGNLFEALAVLSDGVPPEVAEKVARLRQDLLRVGVRESWLQEAEQQTQHLKKLQDDEKKRPPELAQVARLLHQLRAWSEIFGGAEEAKIRSLERDQKAVVMADWATVPAELQARARLLEKDLTERASLRRRESRVELGRRLGELLRICGPQETLEKQVAELEARRVRQANEHRQWMQAHRKALERLAAIANGQRAQLEASLQIRLVELAELLAELRADPLSDAVSAAARDAEGEASALVEPVEVESLVGALCRSGEMIVEVRDLRRQALGELDSLHQRQEELRQGSAELRTAVIRLGLEEEAFPCADLDPAIDELTAGVGGTSSLEQALRAAGQLEERLTGRRQRFASLCGGRYTKMAGAFQNLAEILIQIDPEADIPDLPVPPSEPLPAAWVEILVATGIALVALDETALVLEATLTPRRQQLAKQLVTLADGKLDPGERRSVVSLIASLDKADASPSLPPSERLRSLGDLLEEGEGLVHRHQAEANDLLARRNALEERLEACRKLGLTQIHQRWWGRLVALLYGLDAPIVTSQTQHQLAQAEVLGERLERAARRGEARKFGENLAALSLRGEGPAARALLEEIESLPAVSFPSLALRRRLDRAVAANRRATR